jgi:hypothetical protein
MIAVAVVVHRIGQAESPLWEGMGLLLGSIADLSHILVQDRSKGHACAASLEV